MAHGKGPLGLRPAPHDGPHLHHVLLAVVTEVGCAHHVHPAPVLSHQLGHRAWQAGPLSPPPQLHLQEEGQRVRVGCKDSGSVGVLCTWVAWAPGSRGRAIPRAQTRTGARAPKQHHPQGSLSTAISRSLLAMVCGWARRWPRDPPCGKGPRPWQALHPPRGGAPSHHGLPGISEALSPHPREGAPDGVPQTLLVLESPLPNNLGLAWAAVRQTQITQSKPLLARELPLPPSLNDLREHAHRFWDSPESTLGTTSEAPTVTTGSMSACRGKGNV